jgi:hypothetical protein
VRSSACRGLVALAVGAAGGCDLVFGVDGDAAPCGDESFATAASSAVVTADAFSVSWAGDRIVYERSGELDEQPLPAGAPSEIRASSYVPLAIALAPEGDAMFYTAEGEPPLLQAIVRSGAGWQLDPVVPDGATAGVPSAAEFGPRRVLVRVRSGWPEVQEYEADGDRWRPVGDVHALGDVAVLGSVARAPNLTPSGLDMIYAVPDGDAPAVFIAHRASTAAWFGPPVAILPGSHAFPQLLGRCRTLYALEAAPSMTVRRYDR